MKHSRAIFLAILLTCCLPAAAADIRVHCQGQGPPAYLIGGGPAFTTWNLRPIQKQLGARYTVCRWDMRGVGDNAGLPIEPQASVISQWLRDMQEVLPPEPVVLWGHSWGALQVLLFTRANPERVSKLVLSNPVDPALLSLVHIERKRFNHPDTQRWLQLEEYGTPVEDLYNLRSKIASYFVDAEQGWAYAAGFTQRDANNALNIRVWNEYRQAPLADADVRQLAGRISGIIYCRDDVLQPESLTEYARLLGRRKQHVLTGCAHFPWEENPDDYYRVLSRLIGG